MWWNKRLVSCVAVLLGLGANRALADVFNMPSGQTSLTFVTVGNPGNVADPNTGGLYGSVPYVYQMGTYDVTLGQYCQFLNAVATASDPYGLYSPYMAPNVLSYFSVNLGITQSSTEGGYSYSVTGNGNVPVFLINWGDAARFCNWLQNGQPTGPEGNGTTEAGAYTLSGATSNAALMAVTRNAGATYFIPSENEWYKAAYYDPTLNGGAGGYWTYPTKSNSVPSNVLSTTGTNNANYAYSDPTNLLTPVGYFAGSPGPYGTFDMGGDVWQWNEAVVSASDRGMLGGAFSAAGYGLASSYAGGSDPANGDIYFGFRVASTPEPGSITLLVAGAVAGWVCWRRRR
jgi:formylglycine-generating enzyme required for sulfatase activity